LKCALKLAQLILHLNLSENKLKSFKALKTANQVNHALILPLISKSLFGLDIEEMSGLRSL